MNTPMTLDLADLIRDMDTAAIIDKVDAMGLGNLVADRWLMTNRQHVQRHYANQRGVAR